MPKHWPTQGVPSGPLALAQKDRAAALKGLQDIAGPLSAAANQLASLGGAVSTALSDPTKATVQQLTSLTRQAKALLATRQATSIIRAK
jgi:hypothetical protein